MPSTLNAGHFTKLSPDASIWAWQLKTAEQTKIAERKLVNEVAKATAVFFRAACLVYAEGLSKTAAASPYKSGPLYPDWTKDELAGKKRTGPAADVYRDWSANQMPSIHSPEENRRNRNINDAKNPTNRPEESGANGEFVTGPDGSQKWKGKREIGYSAQAFAAEELYHAVAALSKALDLQIRPGSAASQYKRVQTVLNQIITEFDPKLRNSTQSMLDSAAKRLLATMPPLENHRNISLWAKTVAEQTKAQVLKLTQQNTLRQQQDTLRGFWGKDQGKAFDWAKDTLRAPKKQPAVAPQKQRVAGGRFISDSDTSWTWKVA